MSLLLFWKKITGGITSKDLGYKPRGWVNLLIARGYASRTSAIVIDDGTLMDDVVVIMESLTALMGGLTNEDIPPSGSFANTVKSRVVVFDRLPLGVISSTKPKGGF